MDWPIPTQSSPNQPTHPATSGAAFPRLAHTKIKFLTLMLISETYSPVREFLRAPYQAYSHALISRISAGTRPYPVYSTPSIGLCVHVWISWSSPTHPTHNSWVCLGAAAWTSLAYSQPQFPISVGDSHSVIPNLAHHPPSLEQTSKSFSSIGVSPEITLRICPQSWFCLLPGSVNDPV